MSNFTESLRLRVTMPKDNNIRINSYIATHLLEVFDL